MNVAMACIAGQEAYRQWDLDAAVESVGSKSTPFGDSGEIFLVSDAPVPFYLLPRHGRHLAKAAPGRVNMRANLYALKDLGVQSVLAWAPGGAITHGVAVGDFIVLADVVDQTYLRDKTFFEDSALGYLRQFPVFCPALRETAVRTLHDLGQRYHDGGATAVTEGPRLETPAEIRMLAHVGVDYVTHAFVPEVFLAKELQLCYAAVLYVVNYAETGSHHRPFAPGGLFGGLTEKPEAERLAHALGCLSEAVAKVAEGMAGQMRCDCDKTMATQAAAYDLGEDWRSWFDVARG